MTASEHGGAGNSPPRRGRISSDRKAEAVLRLLAGEDSGVLSRDLRVGSRTLDDWRRTFVEHGSRALRTRPRSERDDEVRRLRARFDEVRRENEVLRRRARAAEAGRPLAPRRPMR